MNNLFITDLPLEPTPLGGKARILADNPRLRLVNLVLLPGERVGAHSAPVEVIFLVMEGQGVLIVEGEKHELRKDRMFVCPPGLMREIEADAEAGLNLLVIRTPNL